MKELLLDMLNRLPGALGAAVVGPDGLAVASSTIRPGVNMEVASAETIHVVKRTGWTPDGEAQEPPEEIALASRTRLTVMRALGSGYFLCLVTGPETIPGQARYEAWRAGQKLREVIG